MASDNWKQHPFCFIPAKTFDGSGGGEIEDEGDDIGNKVDNENDEGVSDDDSDSFDAKTEAWLLWPNTLSYEIMKIQFSLKIAGKINW